MCAIPLLAGQKLSAQESQPLRLAVAGLSHAHLGEVSNRIGRGDFIIVGVAEQDDKLRNTSGLRNKVDTALFYADLGEMLDRTKPEAVIVYEPIFDHLRVVEACAPRGIHVMVEKPLAVSAQHAEKMAALASKYKIHLLTNYETSWYPTLHEAYKMVNQDQTIGKITRMNIYDGHRGPIEIGCGKEFTDWLTDPVRNGGGAVIDFGCYGANLATWMMRGEKPVSVYAVLKQQKPDIYPKVDDDATILVEYEFATAEIMASWNWPIDRKDMHIYGQKGYIYQDNRSRMRVPVGRREETLTPAALPEPYNDPFRYLKAVVRGEITLKPYDLASVENNVIVVKILDAAKESSKTGKTVKFK